MSFILAMEDADNSTEVSSEVEAAQTETQVVADQAEVAAVSDEIGDEVNSAQQGLVDAEELTDIQEVATGAIERGDGLSEDAAAMATIAVERIHHRLYGDYKQRIVPAKESFGHTSSRLASTIAVKESITETLKNFWEAIKTFAARIWDKIKGLVAKVLGSNKMAGKNIESLTDRVKKLDPSFVKKEDKLDNESLAKSISVAGKANLKTAMEVTNNADTLVKVADALSGVTDTLIGGITSIINQQDPVAIAAKINAFSTSAISAPKSAGLILAAGMSAVSPSKTKTAAGSTSTTSLYGPFPNSVVLTVKDTVSTLGNTTINTVSFGFSSAKPKAIADKADALSQGEILEVLKQAQKINDNLVSYGKVANEYKKITDGVTKLADTIMNSIVKMAETKSDPAAGRIAKEAQRAVQEALAITNTFSSQGLGTLNSAVHVLTNYASASLANLGPKK